MAKKDTRLTGLNPLSYIGVESKSPMTFLTNNRAPTSVDNDNFTVGTLWLDTSADDLYMLVDITPSTATWNIFYTDSTITDTITCDTGTCTPSSQEVSIVGDSFIETSGAGNTVTVSMSQGADGQLFIGKTADVPAWANITSTGGSITITNGANSINLETVPGAAGLLTLTGDTGTATPVAGDCTIAGGINLNTSATGSTVTVNMDDSVTLGGTLTLSALGVGVVQTNSSGVVASNTGTNGQVLVGGGSAPAWANITSSDASITVTNGANSIDLAANTGSGTTTGFSAYVSSGVNNITGDGTEYTVIFNNELFDTGSNYNASTGIYTCPVDGKYFFSGKVDLVVDSGSGGYCLNSYIRASAGSVTRAYGMAIPTRRRCSNYYGYNDAISTSCQTTLDLSAGDTVWFSIISSSGSKVDDIPTPGANEASSYFFGYLIRSD